ncbi:MAG: hypothetical protein HYR60_33545 [Acidobacteria bacterium]|nr:hypothetical protein [Acidobacteriota bacterium]
MTKHLVVLAGVALLAGCGQAPGDKVQAATGGLFSGAGDPQIPAGTVLRVRLQQSLDTSRNRMGDSFSATLDSPVVLNTKTVLPKGTVFQGRLVEADSSGRLKGRAHLAVTLESFDLYGVRHRIATGAVRRAGGSHKKRNWIAIGGGAGTGAAIGAIAGGGAGALIGAGAGAAAGTAGAALTGKQNLYLPAETVLMFSLVAPVELRSKG